MYAVIASMSTDGAKKLKPDSLNPYRNPKGAGETMKSFIGGLRQMKAEQDKARGLNNGAVTDGGG